MTKRLLLLAGAALLAAAAVVGHEILTSSSQLCAAPQKMSFSEDIVPILQGRCVMCHKPGSAGFEKSGLDLTSYEGFMKGTKFGPMVIPGDPESSNVMLLLDWRASTELRMPHGKKKLSSCDRDAFRLWIREGAKNN